MIRSMYDWVFSLAAHRNALLVLAFVSFIESSVFPIPPDVLLIPMILAARNRAWMIAGVCTLASVLGGCFGYALGYFFYDALGQPILSLYGYEDKFEVFRARYNEWGAWAVLIAGVTPFPYKVITILSGVTGLDFAVFTVSSIIARAARFFIIAALLYWFGPPVRNFIEKRLGMVFGLAMVLLIGGFVVARYLI